MPAPEGMRAPAGRRPSLLAPLGDRALLEDSVQDSEEETWPLSFPSSRAISIYSRRLSSIWSLRTCSSASLQDWEASARWVEWEGDSEEGREDSASKEQRQEDAGEEQEEDSASRERQQDWTSREQHQDSASREQQQDSANREQQQDSGSKEQWEGYLTSSEDSARWDSSMARNSWTTRTFSCPPCSKTRRKGRGGSEGELAEAALDSHSWEANGELPGDLEIVYSQPKGNYLLLM